MRALFLALAVLLASVAYADDVPLVVYGNEPTLRDAIILTIDDCLDETLTRRMFEFLRDREVAAVFFPIGSALVRQDPTLWREIVAAGFEIGYHTYFHDAGMTIPQLERDFARFQADLRTVLDDPAFTIRYVRPPFGIWDRNWLQWAENNQLVTVRWNVVVRFDLRMPYVEAVLTHPDGGGIFLLHPRQTDVNWLERHFDALRALRTTAGTPYRITTLSEALLAQSSLD